MFRELSNKNIYLYPLKNIFMDGLHRIIKSLTKAEKRYFKLFASTFKDDTKLVKLFDVMDAFEFEDYTDEKAAKKAGIDTITSSKTKLRKLVLKAMRNFNEDTDDAISLRNGLSDIEFLIKKQLVSEATKEYHKHKKYADEFLAFDTLTRLAVQNLHISENPKSINAFETFFDEAFSENERNTKSLFENNRGQLFHSKVGRYMLTFQHEIPIEKEKTIRKYLSDAERYLAETESPIAKISLLDTLQQCHHNLSEFEEAKKCGDEILNLYVSHPFLKQANWGIYWAAIVNLVVAKIQRKELAEAALMLPQLEKDIADASNFFRNNAFQKFRMSYRLFHSKMAIAHYGSDFKSLLLLESELEYWLTQTDFNVQVALIQISVLRYISSLFQTQNFKKAKQWLNRYAMLDVAKQVKMLYYISRLFEVMVLLELADFDQAEQKANNLYKILLDAELDSPIFIHIRTLLLRLPKWDFEDKNHKAECEKWIERYSLLKLEEEGKAEELYEFIDIGKWLEGKLEKA